MRDVELIPTDYDVMDVLMEGPETIANIALETGFRVETVRRSIHKLKYAGYVIPRFMERTGQFRAMTVYELARTRKAA